jgi:hypothetical protein
MTLTNFHHASQMLERAGGKRELQARIGDCGTLVYVNYTSFAQETLDRFSQRIRGGGIDQWASKQQKQYPLQLTRPSDPWPKIPHLCISPAFGLPNSRLSSGTSKKEPELDFVFVVEGISGSVTQKLVLEYDIHNAGVRMFHEAMNGYSIVFSAAISKKVTYNLFFMGSDNHSVTFEKVASVVELAKVEPRDFLKSHDWVVPVLC